MQKKKCLLCIKIQRRFGMLNFSNNNEIPTFDCQCEQIFMYQFHDEHWSKEDYALELNECYFCEKTFDTATELYFHTNKIHTMNDLDECYFYSVVGNSIIGNLDKITLDGLSSLIDALQTNVDIMNDLIIAG